MSTMIRIVSSLFLSLAVVAGAHGGVIVVDPGGGAGGAALLQSAIDSAQNGDILLLRPGDYSSVPGSHPQVVDKSLALIVDGPAGSVVLSGLKIESVAADSVLVRGLHVAPQPLAASGLAAVEVKSEGGLWFEDCVFTGGLTAGGDSLPGFGTPGGRPFTGTLTLVRCTITGADGADEVPGISPARPGADGANMQFVVATIQECTLQGGRGGDGDPFVGGNPSLALGGRGLHLEVAFGMSLLGGTLRGGDEGENNPVETKPGPGLFLYFGTSYVRHTEIHAGMVNGAGTPTTDIETLSVATITNFPASVRSLSVPSPLREGAASVLHTHGEVGDGVWVFPGLAAGLQLVPVAQGNFVLNALLPTPVFVGTISNVSGDLDLPFHAPVLAPGYDGFVIYLQSAMVPASGGWVLGSGSALVVLDSAL